MNIVERAKKQTLDQYTKAISDIMSDYAPKDLSEYGTGDTQIGVPEWLKKLSEFGYGEGYEQARFQNESRSIIEQSRSKVRNLEKQFAAGGIGGGFQEQEAARTFGAEFRQLETLSDTISTENQNAMLRGKQAQLGLEQSNAERALQYQTALANQDFSLFQMMINELQAQRDITTQAFYGGA